MNARIHRILVLLALSALTLSLPTCGQSDPATTGQAKLAKEPYVSADRYSIAYPDGWVYQEETFEGSVATDFGPAEDDVRLTLWGPFISEVAVYLLPGEQLSADTLDKVVDRRATMIERYGLLGWDDWAKEEVETLTIAGLPAAAIEARGTAEDGTPQVAYFVVILGDTRGLYANALVPAEEWESFRPVLFQMLDTVEFAP